MDDMDWMDGTDLGDEADWSAAITHHLTVPITKVFVDKTKAFVYAGG